MICTSQEMLFGRGEVPTGIWWGDLREKKHVKDVGVDERIILKWIFEKLWTGSICFRIGTVSRRL